MELLWALRIMEEPRERLFGMIEPCKHGRVRRKTRAAKNEEQARVVTGSETGDRQLTESENRG
jgi:hypothetical protein